MNSMIWFNIMYFVADILLGYIPQAAGCAICLYAINGLSINSGKFWATTGIFSGIAVVIRTAYNIKLLDFGFHTIIIWTIFVLVAIGFNKLPAVLSIVSILVSGILITGTALILIYGNENFSYIMNNTQTLEGRITKAVCGIPANILFVVFVLIFYFAKRAWKKKRAAKQSAPKTTANEVTREA